MGISSFSALGPIGAAFEVVIILYPLCFEISPANMKMKVELAANKGFIAQFILEDCQKTPKKVYQNRRSGKKNSALI